MSNYQKKLTENYDHPRSQALSPSPPLVGRKTLVAAGHVTTNYLCGKKICWVGECMKLKNFKDVIVKKKLSYYAGNRACKGVI